MTVEVLKVALADHAVKELPLMPEQFADLPSGELATSGVKYASRFLYSGWQCDLRHEGGILQQLLQRLAPLL